MVVASGWIQAHAWADETLARPTEPRPYHEIQAELRAAMRKEAKSKDPAQWAVSVVKLTKIYSDLMRDTRRADSATLESYRVKLRHRLLQIHDSLEADEKRRRRHMTESPVQRQERLYRSVRRLARLEPPDSEEDWPKLLAAANDGSDAGAAGRGGAARGDYGPALVELIYRTISPKFWNVNGGPGSIAYYRPWFALVIRATPEIHRQIGGALGGVRK